MYKKRRARKQMMLGIGSNWNVLQIETGKKKPGIFEKRLRVEDDWPLRAIKIAIYVCLRQFEYFKESQKHSNLF